MDVREIMKMEGLLEDEIMTLESVQNFMREGFKKFAELILCPHDVQWETE